MLDPDHFPEPRRVRLKMLDRVDDPLVLRATLIPTIGDVIKCVEAAGCRFYQPALARLACARPRAPFPCVFIHETNNPYDDNAIALWTRGGHCGYLPRDCSPDVIGPLARLEAAHGTLIAVNADLCPADFGLSLLLELPGELDDDDEWA